MIENSGLDLTVPERLNTKEKIIIDAKNAISDRKYLYRGLVSTNANQISISVSPANVARALRFMDTFIKLLKARGHKLELKYQKNYAIVFEQEIEIGLREKKDMEMVQTNYSWKEAKYTPTGLLIFKMTAHYSYHKEWIDGEIPIEKQLSRILATLEYKAEEERLERIERNKSRTEEKKQKEIRREVRLRKEKELNDFQALLTTSKRWFKSKSLREYIDEVERKAVLNDTIPEQLNVWLKWARKKADWYDPTVESEDDLLKEVDRNKLEFVTKREYWDFMD